jgi:hypothetical protein
MATDFVNRTTNELGFVRFYGGDARGTLYEFGTVSQFERVLAALRAGEVFDALGRRMLDDPTTARRLSDLMADGRVTFGEFPVTVEVGSGDLFNFTTEE